MELTAKNIKKTARILFKGKSPHTRSQLINPSRDWLIGMCLGLFILIGMMAWSAYMYTSNRSGDVADTAVKKNGLPIYRAAAVSDALNYFSERERMFNELREGVVLVQEEPEELEQTETASSTATTTEEVSEPQNTASSSEPAEQPAENNSTSTETVVPSFGP